MSWDCSQVQLLLNEYLDVRNTEKSQQRAPSAFDDPNMDIGQYFLKKRPQKLKKVHSFVFYCYSEINVLCIWLPDTEVGWAPTFLVPNKRFKLKCKIQYIVHVIKQLFTNK